MNFKPADLEHMTFGELGWIVDAHFTRLRRQADCDIKNAWLIANFSSAAQAGKLKPLHSYLKRECETDENEARSLLEDARKKGLIK